MRRIQTCPSTLYKRGLQHGGEKMARSIICIFIVAAASLAPAQDCLQRIGRVDLAPQVPDYIAVDGMRALTAGSGVVRLVDLSFPDDPTMTGVFDPDGWAAGPLDLAGNHGYVCDTWNNRVHILDLSNPGEIVVVGVIEDIGHVEAVEVIPPYAYVAGSGLSIFDISDPTTPTAVSSIALLDGAKDLSVELPYVYLAAWWEGLVIIDVSDPENPVQVGQALAETDDWAYVEASEGWVYMPIGGSMVVVDARDPANPVSEGYPFHGGTSSADVHGGTALVSRPVLPDLAQFDVATPTAPVLLGTLPVSRWYAPVPHHGRYGLVAGDESFLDVVALCDTPGLDHNVWLEIAANNYGLVGSSWRTDLVVRNTSAEATETRLILHTEGGEHVFTDTLAGGSQKAFEDIVGLMQTTGKGALEIRSTEPVAAVARIYNVDDEGTFGQVFQGFPTEKGLRADESAWLHGLRQQLDRYRTNISITNTGTSSARVLLTFYDDAGVELLDYETQIIGARSVIQEVEPLAAWVGPDVGWAMARVTVIWGEGILASASVIDSMTNDPSTIPMWRPDPQR